MSSNPETLPTEEPLAYRAVRGGLWVAFSSYWTLGFGFAANIVLTRLLSPEAFGTFALAMFFAQLLRLQTKLGLGYAFAQNRDTTGESLGTYFVMDLAAALCGLALILLSAPVLLRLGYASAVVGISVALALAAFAEGMAGTGSTLLDKALHFDQASLVQSIVFPLSYVPAFWLALRGGGVWSLVAQNAAYNVLLLIGVWWAVRARLPQLWQVRWRFSPKLARQFLGFGVTVGLGFLAAMLLTQLDNFMIGTFVGVTVLGFYDRAYRIAEWPSKLFNSLNLRAGFYTYAKLQDDRIRLEKTATMMLWLITTLALPMALVIFVTAPDVLVLLYGERWLPSAFFVRILVIYSVVRPLWENAGTFLTAIGKPHVTTMLITVQVLVLAIAGVPLTIMWGATGTCVAVGLAFAVGILLIYRNIVREISLKLKTLVGSPVLVGLLTLLGYLALNRLTGLTHLPLLARVAVKSLYTIAAFFVLTFIGQPGTTRERVGNIWRLAIQSKK